MSEPDRWENWSRDNDGHFFHNGLPVTQEQYIHAMKYFSTDEDTQRVKPVFSEPQKLLSSSTSSRKALPDELNDPDRNQEFKMAPRYTPPPLLKTDGGDESDDRLRILFTGRFPEDFGDGPLPDDYEDEVDPLATIPLHEIVFQDMAYRPKPGTTEAQYEAWAWRVILLAVLAFIVVCILIVIFFT